MNPELFLVVVAVLVTLALTASFNTLVSFRQARTDPYLILRRASYQRAWLWLLTTLMTMVVLLILILLQIAG